MDFINYEIEYVSIYSAHILVLFFTTISKNNVN